MAEKTRKGRWAPDQGRGREADRPREIPKRGWKDILVRVKEEQSNDNLSLVAAGVAFYGFLAVFPALAALISIYGLVADPAQVQQQISELSGFLPQQAQQLIGQQLSRIVGNTSGALSIGIAGGILVSLWSANKGMKGLMAALNITYDERETRGFFKLNAISLLLTFLAVVSTVLSLFVIGAIPALLGNLGLPETVQSLIAVGRWVLLAALVIVGLAVLYRYAPDRDRPKWRWVNWGSITATLLWIAASLLFSFYAQNFADYNKTYGTIGVIIILLMWFFITAYAILIGAEMNAEMEHQTRADSTRGEPQAMGRRGAHAADTLGEKKGE